jgi:hypothetical protein
MRQFEPVQVLAAVRMAVTAVRGRVPARALAVRVAAIIPGRRLAALLGAAAVSVALAGPASAAATVGRFTVTNSGPPIAISDDCRGVTGTLAGTDVLDYQVVDTGTTFHFEGTDSSTDLLFTFSDGSYGTGGFVDRLSFNAGPGATEFTNAHSDSATLYTADGQLLYSLTFRLVEHFTVAGNVVRVEFERVVVDTGPCGR